MARRDRRARKAKKKIEPLAIFLHALGFNVAFRALNNEWEPWHPSGRSVVNIPIAVMSAFASELLFKTLIAIETGQVPRGHHLDALFNALSRDTQKRVMKKWEEFLTAHEPQWVEMEKDTGRRPPDLLTALKLGSKTFELARYIFEQTEDFTFYLGPLPEMLAEMVFELDPNMKSYAAQGYDQQKLDRPDGLKDIEAKSWKGSPIPGYP